MVCPRKAIWFSYSERDAAQSIIENNLFGVDIDERAYQYAYFAIMMKARSYDRRFLTRNLKPKLAIIEESNEIESYTYKGITYNKDLDKIGEYLYAVFKDAKEIGSLQTVEKGNYQAYIDYLNSCKMEGQMSIDGYIWIKETLPTLIALAKQAEILAAKYTIVCTNPPYIPNSKMTTVLKTYIEEQFRLFKNDTFSAFIYRCMDYCINKGYIGMLTPFVWLFISSYRELRNEVLNKGNLSTLVQLEYNSFEPACVPVCAFIVENTATNRNGDYIKLSDFKGIQEQAIKTLEAIKDKECKYRYSVSKDLFYRIPTNPIAYWASKNFIELFEKNSSLADCSVIFEGLKTRDKDRFTRLWFEVSNDNWKPYAKGGGFRRWYGNNEYVVKWGTDGNEIKNFKKSSGANFKHFNTPTVTYSALTSYKFSSRYIDISFFGGGGGGITNTKFLIYILGLTNSCVFNYIINTISPTLNFEVGQIGLQPFVFSKEFSVQVENIVNENISISKNDWDSFETSWDFSKHPLIEECNIREAFEFWIEKCERDFKKLKSNEEELNRIFVEIYGLQDELTSEVEDKDITLKTNTAYRYKQKKKSSENDFEPEEEFVEAKEIRDQRFLRDTITEFISYAVGCMFGRYSLDVEGLAYACGEWDETKYSSFIPDKDNIIPICDDEYFDDDITGRFIEFIKTVYDEKSLEENLNFISIALGGKGSSREIIRNYFINDFFKDHCNMYTSRGAGKRPIYWLFDSGKKNGFKALIYMHRYSRDLLAKLRTDYVHEQQERYRTQLSHIAGSLNTATGVERARLLKQQDKLSEQAREINAYEEKVHHLADMNIAIDLDDGVSKNYEIFADVLAKI